MPSHLRFMTALRFEYIPKWFPCWKHNPKVMVWRGVHLSGSGSEVIGSWWQSPHEQSVWVYHRHLLPGEHTARRTIYVCQGRVPHQTLDLTLIFPAPTTMEKGFLLFVSHPFWDIFAKASWANRKRLCFPLLNCKVLHSNMWHYVL